MSVRDVIFGARDLREKTVHVPEWGVNITLREMSVADSMIYSGMDKSQSSAMRILIATAYDESGERIFTPDDAEMLSRKSAHVIGRLLHEVNELTGEAGDDPND